MVISALVTRTITNVNGDAVWCRYPRGAPGPASPRRLGCPVQPRLLLPALSGVPGLSFIYRKATDLGVLVLDPATL